MVSTNFNSDRIGQGQLWHQRFAHINDVYVNHAIKNNLVTGVTSISSSNKSKSTKVFKSPPCESCILAKGHRISASRTPGSTHSRTTRAGLQLTSQPINSTPSDSSANKPIIDSIQTLRSTSYPSSAVFNSSQLNQPFAISNSADPASPLDTSSTTQSIPTSQLKFPPLHKLAVDIKGPINVSDNRPSAKKYVLIFTCMSTRYRFVAFLKSKDEAVIYSRKLIKYLKAINSPVHEIEQLVQEETDDSFFDLSMIDLLRELNVTPTRKLFSEMHSDNGSEFINEEMESLLEESEIIHSTTSPYTPHQNGIAERTNRTVFDLAAACMHQSGLAIKHYTHAVQFVIHTLNH